MIYMKKNAVAAFMSAVLLLPIASQAASVQVASVVSSAADLAHAQSSSVTVTVLPVRAIDRSSAVDLALPNSGVAEAFSTAFTTSELGHFMSTRVNGATDTTIVRIEKIALSNAMGNELVHLLFDTAPVAETPKVGRDDTGRRW